MLGLKTEWYRSAQSVRATPTDPQFDSGLESGNHPPAGGSRSVGRLAAGKISLRQQLQANGSHCWQTPIRGVTADVIRLGSFGDCARITGVLGTWPTIQIHAAFRVPVLWLLLGEACKASHAASVANFSSWDQGAPKALPSSVTRPITSTLLRRKTCPAWSRSSFSLILKSRRPQRALAWRIASRKSSPSAV